jgi:hypothetical protein
VITSSFFSFVAETSRKDSLIELMRLEYFLRDRIIIAAAAITTQPERSLRSNEIRITARIRQRTEIRVYFSISFFL